MLLQGECKDTLAGTSARRRLSSDRMWILSIFCEFRESAGQGDEILWRGRSGSGSSVAGRRLETEASGKSKT